MPKYDYECNDCDYDIELSHPIDAETPVCKFCGQELRKIFSAVPVQFKGGGFYSTGG